MTDYEDILVAVYCFYISKYYRDSMTKVFKKIEEEI